MAKEIIIPHPELNTEPKRGHSYTEPLSRRRFEELCANRGITPATHPLVCDLFAGTGGMAAIVKDHGWLGKNITHIDKCCIWQGRWQRSWGKREDWGHWLFWDLWELGRAMVHQEPLPKRVLAYKGKFDLVVSAYNWRVPDEWEKALIEFLVKNKQDTLIVPDDWDWSHLFTFVPKPYPPVPEQV